MLVDKLQLQGINLHINGDLLVFESDAPITKSQLEFLKNNKVSIMAELKDLALVEFDEDGDVFPLHHFKGDHMPYPRFTDFSFIHQQLKHCYDRTALAAHYSRIYLQAYQAESVEQKKDNTARCSANKWLFDNT